MKDFDGGFIGNGVAQALSTPSPLSKVTWTVLPASKFPGGAAEVGAAVLEEGAWLSIISMFRLLFYKYWSLPDNR